MNDLAEFRRKKKELDIPKLSKEGRIGVAFAVVSGTKPEGEVEQALFLHEDGVS